MEIRNINRFRAGAYLAAVPFLGFFGCLGISALNTDTQIAAGPAESDITIMSDEEVFASTLNTFSSPDFVAFQG